MSAHVFPLACPPQQMFPRFQAEALRLWGKQPDEGYIFSTSGNATRLFGSNSLAPVSGPLAPRPQPFTGSPVGAATFAPNSGESYDAGAAGQFDDDGSTSHGFLLFLQILPSTTSTRQIVTKNDSGVFYTLTYLGATRTLSLVIDDGPTSASCVTTQDVTQSGIGGWHPVWMGINRTSDELEIYTLTESITQDISSIGSLSGETLMSLGSATGLAAPDTLTALYYFTGANAEGWSGARLLRLWSAYPQSAYGGQHGANLLAETGLRALSGPTANR